MTHINLTSYEGVESLGRFSPDYFEKYCDDKLKSCDKHITFLREHFPGRPLRVLEIGSGSGKLLFRLEREGMLEHGVGFEVSRSRCLFAEKFAKYCQSVKVDVKNEDFLEADLQDEAFDVVIGIDVVTNLIGAISEEHTNNMLSRAHSSLAARGGIVLELMTCEREMNFIRQAEGGFYRTWKRFDESDPFRFGLDELSLDYRGNVVWDKMFIAKTGGFETFTNILRPFSRTTVSDLCHNLGGRLELFGSWAHGDDTSDEEFIALLRFAN
jgi:SAM-dependent methyltransferase